MEMTGEDTRMKWHLMKNYFTVSLMMLHDFQDLLSLFYILQLYTVVHLQIGAKMTIPSKTLLVMTAGPFK